MRQRILQEGAGELKYEIRGIVKRARILEKTGIEMTWENIGDPVKKNGEVPKWMKFILTELLQDNQTYSYGDSKGELATRKFLADLTNTKGGAQITAEDVLFFNGLGDAIAKIYQYLDATSRVIGPSPAYSTHSSAEATHANHDPLTYQLDPNNQWYPDMDDLYNKVKYNPNIVGILIINPDNPTGMVYPKEVLKQFVEIAREFDLFLVSDEIYLSITYNQSSSLSLAEVIEEVPGIALKGISKDMPWPGARCGWAEFYNREKNEDFYRYTQALESAKMIEVCSTKLPQLAIPKVYAHPEFPEFRKRENEKIGRRSERLTDLLGDIPYIYFNPTNGSFFNTIVFREEYLKEGMQMDIRNKAARDWVEKWIEESGIQEDQRFTYYLMAAYGVCVVPISSFCTPLQGFRVTLLEEDEKVFTDTFTRIRKGIMEYFE